MREMWKFAPNTKTDTSDVQPKSLNTGRRMICRQQGVVREKKMS